MKGSREGRAASGRKPDRAAAEEERRPTILKECGPAPAQAMPGYSVLAIVSKYGDCLVSVLYRYKNLHIRQNWAIFYFEMSDYFSLCSHLVVVASIRGGTRASGGKKGFNNTAAAQDSLMQASRA